MGSSEFRIILVLHESRAGMLSAQLTSVLYLLPCFSPV